MLRLNSDLRTLAQLVLAYAKFDLDKVEHFYSVATPSLSTFILIFRIFGSKEGNFVSICLFRIHILISIMKIQPLTVSHFSLQYITFLGYIIVLNELFCTEC